MKLDGIIVTTTPEMHTEVAEKAFAAGMHVMVEKPITLTVAEGVRLVAAGKTSRPQAGCGRKLPPRPDQPSGQGAGG